MQQMSQSTFDNMQVSDLIDTAKYFVNQIEQRINDPYDAQDFVKALTEVANELNQRIQLVTQD